MRFINEYLMTDSPFIKIIYDMKRDSINQRDQEQEWGWDNTLLNNKTDTMDNKTPVFLDLKQNKSFPKDQILSN